MNQYLRSTILVALSAAALSLPACSSGSETTSTVLAPAGPAAMSIISPKQGTCAVLSVDDPAGLRVTISTTNWSMRPVGYCGAYLQCGHVVAFADDVRVAQASALVIDVPLTQGDHTIRIELRDDSDVIGQDANGKPLEAQIKVHAAASGEGCGLDGGTDSGADGGTDSGADAGTDSGADAGTDSGADAGTDSGVDGGTDSGADGGTDSGVDGGADGGTDGATDASPQTDASSDS